MSSDAAVQMSPDTNTAAASAQGDRVAGHTFTTATRTPWQSSMQRSTRPCTLAEALTERGLVSTLRARKSGAMPTRQMRATALAAVVPAQPYEPTKLDGWACGASRGVRKTRKWKRPCITSGDPQGTPRGLGPAPPHLRTGEAAQDEVGERDEENRRSEATEDTQRLQWPRRRPALR